MLLRVVMRVVMRVASACDEIEGEWWWQWLWYYYYPEHRTHATYVMLWCVCDWCDWPFM